MFYSKKHFVSHALIILLFSFTIACSNDSPVTPDTKPQSVTSTSSADYSSSVVFKGSKNSSTGKIYEVLPGPAVINPAMNPTPFSNSTQTTTGSYSFVVEDLVDVDSQNSTDSVVSVNIEFTANDGKKFKIDKINIIHKPDGMGDHTFYGNVGLNKVMHGNTGVGTGLMPKMLSYITFWGITDLKDGNGNVLASNRLIHLMVASRARTSDLKLVTDAANDVTDHSTDKYETHVILPPLDTSGNPSPVPGTGHGFLHLMFENVSLAN